jgi:hypothetical protein
MRICFNEYFSDVRCHHDYRTFLFPEAEAHFGHFMTRLEMLHDNLLSMRRSRASNSFFSFFFLTFVSLRVVFEAQASMMCKRNETTSSRRLRETICYFLSCLLHFCLFMADKEIGKRFTFCN